MSLWEIAVIGLGLSMDAAAVCMSNGMLYPGAGRNKVLAQPILFGLFQSLMPAAGYFAGALVSELIERYAGMVTLAILAAIGGKMIYDGLHPECDDDDRERAEMSYLLLLLQAIATSLDAFAVGVSFSAMRVHIVSAAVIIGSVTFLCGLAAVWIGKRFGDGLGGKAQLFGGAVLILIGIKSLF